MLLSVDLRGIEQDGTDLVLLQAYLQPLIGQPFLHFRFSYGDEVGLHFGDPHPYSFPKMKHLTKGSFILGTRASKWLFSAPSRSLVILGCDDRRFDSQSSLRTLSKIDLETTDVLQPGKVVESVSLIHGSIFGLAATGIGLSLRFSNGTSLAIIPSPPENSASEGDIADWEFFTPYDRYLRVGPGQKWSYLPSRHTAAPAVIAAGDTLP
ncbi:MAG: hypothetical protein K2X38_14930 [Gemmataceae bacterium]|nr:hypothetical protein [Gemmataceae bacterium]